MPALSLFFSFAFPVYPFVSLREVSSSLSLRSSVPLCPLSERVVNQSPCVREVPQHSLKQASHVEGIALL